MQATVSVRQSLDCPLNWQPAVSTSPRNRIRGPAPLRDRHGVLLFGDIKSNKSFAMLSHGPPSVHEARLGLPEQPSFLYCTKGRATGSAREHDV